MADIDELPAPLKHSAPVWVAPMAGGPSRPELVIASARAGHFAQLAAGYKSVEAMTAEVEPVRQSGVTLFGVNLFVPNVHAISPADYDRYARSLQATAHRLELTDSSVPLREDDDAWDAKIAYLLAHPIPVVSFTFGLPEPAVFASFRGAGTLTVQTVTSVDEAVAAESAGADLLAVQGAAAGGHSGIWAPDQKPADIPLPELVATVRSVVALPVVAAGGIGTRDDVSAALAAGAVAVSVGTVVLRTPESGTSPVYRAALVDRQYTLTTLTRSFTGRYARALVNRFVSEHDAEAPSGYPAIHHLTRPIRAASTAQGDSSAVNLWAGTGWHAAVDAPVADVLAALTPGA